MRQVYPEQENDGWRVLELVALPPDLADQLDREERRREEQRREQQVRDAERYAEPKVATTRRSGKGLPWTEPFRNWGGPVLKVLSSEDVEKDAAAMESRSQDAEAKSRKSAIHKLMASRGEYRKLARIPSDWRQQLDEIEASFPNFVEVVDYLRGMFVMAELGDGVPRIDPLLLDGPPGVGKSFFSERMARFLGSGFRRINMENAQTNAQLVGSDEFWSNSKGGAVLEVLVESDWGNPVFYVDEVDKAGGRLDYDPMSALYGLLEPGTAANFRDQSIPGIHLDASRIYWILTSNVAALIPEPILSRVRRFDVPNPTPTQAANILNNIYGQVQVEVKLPAPWEPLGQEVVGLLVCVSPRRQKQLLHEAIGRALYAGRNAITSADLRIPSDAGNGDDVAKESGYYNGSDTRPIGFC